MTDLPAIREKEFALLQREAKALQSSNMIPKEFKGNMADCMIAINLAKKIGVDAFTVMQNLHAIHGKMSWSSQFIISALNSCGRFSPLRYEKKGEGMEASCRAWAIDKETGDRLEGPIVTMKMAQDEGWLGKAGSKWKTMPELMLHYRSAAFFGRLYAPDIFNGMHMIDEVQDFMPPKDVTPKGSSADDIIEKLEETYPTIESGQDSDFFSEEPA